MKKISAIIEGKSFEKTVTDEKVEEGKLTVNSNEDDKSTVNSLTVNSGTVKRYSKFELELNKVIEDHKHETDFHANYLAEKLDDTNSVKWYTLLVKNIDITKLYEALSNTLEAERAGKIKHKKAVYFQGILRNWGYKKKFSD